MPTPTPTFSPKDVLNAISDTEVGTAIATVESRGMGIQEVVATRVAVIAKEATPLPRGSALGSMTEEDILEVAALIITHGYREVEDLTGVHIVTIKRIADATLCVVASDLLAQGRTMQDLKEMRFIDDNSPFTEQDFRRTSANTE